MHARTGLLCLWTTCARVIRTSAIRAGRRTRPTRASHPRFTSHPRRPPAIRQPSTPSEPIRTFAAALATTPSQFAPPRPPPLLTSPIVRTALSKRTVLIWGGRTARGSPAIHGSGERGGRARMRLGRALTDHEHAPRPRESRARRVHVVRQRASQPMTPPPCPRSASLTCAPRRARVDELELASPIHARGRGVYRALRRGRAREDHGHAPCRSRGSSRPSHVLPWPDPPRPRSGAGRCGPGHFGRTFSLARSEIASPGASPCHFFRTPPPIRAGHAPPRHAPTFLTVSYAALRDRSGANPCARGTDHATLKVARGPC